MVLYLLLFLLPFLLFGCGGICNLLCCVGASVWVVWVVCVWCVEDGVWACACVVCSVLLFRCQCAPACVLG